MKDYPIGAVFTDSQGVRLEVVENRRCDECYYDNKNVRTGEDDLVCSHIQRADKTSVIFRPVEPQPVCHFTLRNQVR